MIYALGMSSSFLLKILHFYREKILEASIVLGVVGAFILLLFLVGISLVGSSSSTVDEDEIIPLPSTSIISTEQSCCTVEVSGAVIKPGVFQLDSSSRVQEAIQQAGGFLETADAKYIAQKINLAKKVEDQEKIYIPSLNETPDVSIQGEPSSVSSTTSINSASQAQLEDLPTIGEKTAEKIISMRPFSSIESFFQKMKLSVKHQDSLRELISL